MTHHMKSVHDGVTTMKCNQCEFECEYKVNSATKMLLHKETMHGERSYKCDHCNYESKSKQHSMRHKQINHTRPKIVCGHCSFTTKQVWFLKNHVKSAHEGFRWSCDACNGKFKSPALLSLHRGKEHEKKLYTKRPQERSSSKHNSYLRYPRLATEGPPGPRVGPFSRLT